MYVDWEYYKIFYYVAKYQNFTKAARVLGNNQPNITHSMNRLESQLNCVLFIRSNRGVTLTPEGELLYSRIASAAVQIQDAEAELSADYWANPAYNPPEEMLKNAEYVMNIGDAESAYADLYAAFKLQ